MNQIVVTSRLDCEGILQLTLPIGLAEANREVRITIEPVASKKQMTQEEWRRRVLETAGKWQGDFERPWEGELEEREPLS